MIEMMVHWYLKYTDTLYQLEHTLYIVLADNIVCQKYFSEVE